MPTLLHPEDAIVRVTRSCICGSDLHLYNGSVPDTRVGMTFGHEFTGIVEQIGPAVEKLRKGDHVLVPFNIACGKCVFCQQGLFGNCHKSNPEATAVGGIFGYSARVAGWGIDADRRNDPTYPIKLRNNGEHAGYSWTRPPQQPATVEILHSNERPNLSAVFGTSTPPHGLSGALRRFAFRYSESNYAHWLPLMLADRIGVFEGILHDLLLGRLPDFIAERGGRADWRFNRSSVVLRTVVRLLVWLLLIACVIVWITHERRRTGSPSLGAPR